MCPFVESLRIENGKLHHIAYHNERLNRTRREVFGRTDKIDLAEYIVAKQYSTIQKCRVLYDEDIHEVEIAPYQMRIIRNLKIVECNDIEYRYKNTDRTHLNRLFDQRSDCDDILIVRNGLLTDAFAANVALYDGTHWYTPANPLLQGTQRAFLLDQQLVVAKDISIHALSSYQTIRLFNAMIDFGRIEIPVDTIQL